MNLFFELKTKYFTLIFISTFLVILLMGCFKKPMYYNSISDLPFHFNITNSKFELISSEQDFNIIKAIDNDTTKYILFVPGDVPNIRYFSDANLSKSIPITYDKLPSLVNFLKKSLNDWDNKYSSNKGLISSFILAPEHKIFQVSENVKEWHSILKIYYQNNYDGPQVTILFGEGLLYYKYLIDSKNKLQNLIEILEKTFEN